MMRVLVDLYLLTICAILVVACAQPFNPQGGPRDETPPVLDQQESTTNFQVNFRKQDITLVFDEFINLNNPNTNVLISPPLDIKPNIYTRGKEVRIDFDESLGLKKDATYVINFGDAIRDYTENNPLENFSFIFSTGAFIDSLTINGTVVDAYTREPVEETLVMLYDEFRDSIVYEERPFYFAKTLDDGTFEIRNIRADSFKLFVLTDGNANFKKDLDSEMIGFIEEPILVSDGTSGSSYTIELFLPFQKFAVEEYTADTYGKVILLFNDDAENVQLSNSVEMVDDFIETSGDSLIYWYQSEVDTKFELFLQQDEFTDTINIRSRSKSEFLEESSFGTGSLSSGSSRRRSRNNRNEARAKVVRLAPGAEPSILFNAPISTVDTAACQLMVDSLTSISVDCRIDSINRRKLVVDHFFDIDSSFEMRLDSGKIVSIYDQGNQESMYQFNVGTPDEYGTLSIKIEEGLFSDSLFYILELLRGENLYRNSVLESRQDTSLVFELVPPGTYSIRLTEDKNRNRKWDTGSYKEKRFAERIVTKVLENIREGWETEFLISTDIFTEKTVLTEIEIDSI